LELTYCLLVPRPAVCNVCGSDFTVESLSGVELFTLLGPRFLLFTQSESKLPRLLCQPVLVQPKTQIKLLILEKGPHGLVCQFGFCDAALLFPGRLLLPEAHSKLLCLLPSRGLLLTQSESKLPALLI
jgi:hypothetical protein